MRTSNYFLPTLKETPADAEVISHQLMLRAGMIRRVAAGIYNWLPLGYKVLKKVENIVREEMNAAGALEIFMPVVIPAELWQESGRWKDYGPNLLRIKDRHKRDFCLGPTHEEVVTTIIKNDIRSYKQLPLNLYQIQTKFRDEIRPRFGLMRGREFIMKDAYSFDVDEENMQLSYDKMYHAYVRIFDRLGLDYYAVEADNGSIGGSSSHEFQVLADSGEDDIAFNKELSYAANIEKVPSPESTLESWQNIQQYLNDKNIHANATLDKIDTPNVHTMDELAKFCQVGLDQTIKTIIVNGVDSPIALVLRGDHKLNEAKVEKIKGIAKPLSFTDAKTVKELTGSDPGSVGPIGLNIPMYVDFGALLLTDFICGANENDKHFKGVNWQKDIAADSFSPVDIRVVNEGELCPGAQNGETISICKGIEVGHIFQLGQKYSLSMDAYCLDENGKKVNFQMGCYGIGVSRIVAAAIEQNNDENGILWPESIAPFQVAIIGIGFHKSDAVKSTCESLYQKFIDNGYEVLLDDRNERPGIMFKDMELIGIPHQIVVGEKGITNNQVEYKYRHKSNTDDSRQSIDLEELTKKFNL